MVFQKQNYFQRRTRPKGPKTNERIRSPEVQVISSEGKNLGTLPTSEAIDIAKQEELDLVEISLILFCDFLESFCLLRRETRKSYPIYNSGT